MKEAVAFALLFVFAVPVGAQDAASSAASSPNPSEARATVEEIPASEWGEDYQVRVIGGAPLARTVFSAYANDFRADVRWLLFKFRLEAPGGRASWAIPIEIDLRGDLNDVYRGDSLRTTVVLGPDNRFSIKLAVMLHDRFEEKAFRLELVRVLLIEQILVPYARSPQAFALDEVKVPDWIVHGIDQLVDRRRGGSRSSFYRGFLQSGQMLKPRDLFVFSGADGLDPLSYAIFRASSSAMLEALLNQPDGDIGMRNFLGDLSRATPASTELLLRQHYPAFREVDQGLEKWWALELAAMGQQQSLEFLGREETERFLSDALTVRFEGGGEGSGSPGAAKRGLFELLKPKKESGAAIDEPFAGTVDEFALFLHRPGAEQQLEECLTRLQNLKRVGFPLYRPVFAAYEAILLKLEKGDARGVEAELRETAEIRAKIRETLVRAEDFLNYYEATRAPQRSEAFDDYHAMRRSLEAAEPPRRNDRISRYLDSLEMEFR